VKPSPKTRDLSPKRKEIINGQKKKRNNFIKHEIDDMKKQTGETSQMKWMNNNKPSFVDK
jgi:hypothetical protein